MGNIRQCSATPAVAPARTDTDAGVDSGRDSYSSASLMLKAPDKKANNKERLWRGGTTLPMAW